MENVKNFSCWQCQFFEPLAVGSAISGYCRKNAAHSLDSFGFGNATGGGSGRFPLQVMIRDHVEDTETALCRNGFPNVLPGNEGENLPLTLPSSRYNFGTTNPFHVEPGSSIVAISFAATGLAVRGSVVGENPTIQLSFYDVLGDPDTLRGNIFVPVDPDRVDTNNSTGLGVFQTGYHELESAFELSEDGFFGWTLNLVNASGSDEIITATRNLNTTVWIQGPGSSSGGQQTASDALKWAFLGNAPDSWCGDFKKSPKEVPPVPAIVEVE